MTIARALRHLVADHRAANRVFPVTALKRIEAAIAASEATHTGQIRVAIEAALPVSLASRGVTSRSRALDAFSTLRVWDTEENCGVLVYVLLADHAVEIVADRGIHAKVGDEAWVSICRMMEQAFAQRRFEDGVIEGVGAIGELLKVHFARKGPGRDELPNAPILM